MDSAVNNPDDNTTLDRITKLEERVSELTGLLQSLAVAAQFSDDEPFEAVCVQHMITGQQRSAIQMQIAIMRARRKNKSVEHYPETLFPQYPSVVASKTQSFTSLEDMAAALAPVAGSQELAAALLKAYEKRGLGR